MRIHSALHAGLAQLLLLACTWLALPATAADIDLPPVDEVFVLSAQATARDRIEVRWQIADGYYLYRHRTSVTADAAFPGAKLALPDGEKHHDEFFGDVQTYRQQLIGVLTGTPGDAATITTLKVKYQGCADAGICYPPQTRTLKVTLPQPSSDGDFGLGKPQGGGLFGFGGNAGAVDAMPLPEAQAFTTEVIADGGNALLLRLTPARGYYLYRDKLSVTLDAGKGLSVALPPASKLPKAKPHRDAHFGDVAVYFDQVEISLPVTRTDTRAARGALVLGMQGCQTDGICYPPMTRRLAVSLPAGNISPSPPPAAERVPQAGEGESAPPNAPLTPSLSPVNGGERVEASIDTAREAPPSQKTPGLLLSLLFALLGGLVLNLMPCVLPVLSLKALSLAQSGESRERARRHALAYTAGVLLSFLALGGLALALRKAGLALGWGFQLQQPLVVAVLALVIFGLGLSLSGLWYASVGIGQRGSALMQRGGISGDFATGVLAVVLATPCIAPLVGTALTYAFTGPMPGGLLVFLMLGFGLALPFLLIGFVPAFARLLPKPGAWMETLKQLLAFPLYLTAAWLLFVLASLRGAEAVWQWALAAVLLALAAWAWMRARSGMRGWRVVALLALLAIAWPLLRLHQLQRPETAASTRHSGIASVAFSEQALAELRAQGRVVFINMTAEWCVSCKVNEKAVFARDSFREALQSANAIYMVGDYTNVDPAITAYLQRHGAVGVPLYVVYPRGGGEGEILPVLLTPAIAADALARAAR
ncbi:MAG: protein-disulfide reductase DsbD [Thermomonas sp.]|uniref:protein-disulfide reductase DsbD family protein n=1 Tax=Thermomonas sp. TaxID=1971895 RepID=UPI0039E6B756